MLSHSFLKKPQTTFSTFPKYKGKFENFEKVHMICSPILLPKSRKLLFQLFQSTRGRFEDFEKVNTKRFSTSLKFQIDLYIPDTD